MAETPQSKSDRPEIVKHVVRINPISPTQDRTVGFTVAMPAIGEGCKNKQRRACPVEQKIDVRHHFSAE